MKTITSVAMCLGLVWTCAAEQVLTDYDWKKLIESGEVSASVTNVDGRMSVKVVNTNDTPLQVHLLTIKNPPVTKMLYAIVGEIKYEGVKGDGYLEMWNYFQPLKPGMPEGAYFSRTLGVSGEMGKISGTSTWRKFQLLFDRTGASSTPTRLEINAFLPGQGTIYVGPIHLVEYEGNLKMVEERGASGPGHGGAWWTERAGGMIGGILGGTIGCLGSVLAWMAAKGKSRGFVVTTSMVLIGVGAVSTLAGVIALAARQPYAVWFVLLLLGVLLIGIFPFRLRDYQRRYSDLELRRMNSMDA